MNAPHPVPWQAPADLPLEHFEPIEPKCTCFPVPPEYWTTHYGAVDPATTLEPNPECSEHFDDPLLEWPQPDAERLADVGREPDYFGDPLAPESDAERLVYWSGEPLGEITPAPSWRDTGASAIDDLIEYRDRVAQTQPQYTTAADVYAQMRTDPAVRQMFADTGFDVDEVLDRVEQPTVEPETWRMYDVTEWARELAVQRDEIAEWHGEPYMSAETALARRVPFAVSSYLAPIDGYSIAAVVQLAAAHASFVRTPSLVHARFEDGLGERLSLFTVRAAVDAEIERRAHSTRTVEYADSEPYYAQQLTRRAPDRVKVVIR